MKPTTLAVSLLAVLALPLAVLAHHGFGGAYDRSQPIFIEGIASTAFFGQPHPEIVLTIAPDTPLPASPPAGFETGLVAWSGASGAKVIVEFPPIGTFFDLDGSVVPGDRIAVIALRNCEPPHQLRGQWVRLADGSEAQTTGRVQSEVNGC
jgi:hypothetical protein